MYILLYREIFMYNNINIMYIYIIHLRRFTRFTSFRYIRSRGPVVNRPETDIISNIILLLARIRVVYSTAITLGIFNTG